MEPQEWQEARIESALFKMLGHPLRLKVADLLRQRGPASPTELAETLGEDRRTICGHLDTLKAAQLVELASRDIGHKGGWRHVYRLSEDQGETVGRVLDLLRVAKEGSVA